MRVFGGVIRLERLLLPQDQGLGCSERLQPKVLPGFEGRWRIPNCSNHVRNQQQLQKGKVCRVN